MKTNTPLADALMLRIRDQYPHENGEGHRKRFIQMVRNGDPDLREEITKSLFAVYLQRATDNRAHCPEATIWSILNESGSPR